MKQGKMFFYLTLEGLFVLEIIKFISLSIQMSGRHQMPRMKHETHFAKQLEK